MNDTREIMTLDDAELDVVSGGFFNGVGNTLNVLSNNHQTLVAKNSISVGSGGGNTIAALQAAGNIGVQLII